MDNHTRCDELSTRFQNMADNDGLVDVKFFLDTSDEATANVVCEEVTRLFSAMNADEYYDLDFKDGTR